MCMRVRPQGRHAAMPSAQGLPQLQPQSSVYLLIAVQGEQQLVKTIGTLSTCDVRVAAPYVQLLRPASSVSAAYIVPVRQLILESN